MTVQPIRLFGDPVLRTPAEVVVDFDKELRTLVADLAQTMLDAPGQGLAAPQIGVGLRVFTYHVDGVLGHLVNPDLDLSEEEQEGDEGCLSFPGIFFPVKRSLRAVVRAHDLEGEEFEFDGLELEARCMLHETDHCDGIVFLDRTTPLKRELVRRKIKRLQKQGRWV